MSNILHFIGDIFVYNVNNPGTPSFKVLGSAASRTVTLNSMLGPVFYVLGVATLPRRLIYKNFTSKNNFPTKIKY